MASTDDERPFEPNLAEALYQQHKVSRATSNIESKVTSSSESSLNTETLTQAEGLYRQYQQGRAPTARISVDEIMETINRNTSFDPARQHDQPSGDAENSSMITRINVTEGNVTDPIGMGSSPAANSPNIFKRFVFGTAAAILLGIVLIPNLIDRPTSHETPLALVPEALASAADQTVAYVEQPAGVTFGFSDSASLEKSAFNQGVLAADLTLAVEANEKTLASTILQQLLEVTSNSEIDKSTATGIRTAIQVLFDAIKDDAAQQELKIHQNNLFTMLETAVEHRQQLNWYLTGHSVESIRIAAELALANSDLTSLEQALAEAKERPQPPVIDPASNQFNALLHMPIDGVEKFVQTGEILRVANDIKLLMQ